MISMSTLAIRVSHGFLKNFLKIGSTQVCNYHNIPYSASGDRAEDEILLKPYIHLYSSPSKYTLPVIAKVFNHWLKIPQDKYEACVEILKAAHISTLLADDIQDGSLMRRGTPCAHHVYGIPYTVNSLNYGYFVTLEKILLTIDHPEASRIYAKDLMDLHIAQGVEMHWRDLLICPTEQEYCEVAMKKTAAVPMLVLDLMQLYSNDKRDYSNLMRMLALSFQILNDLQILSEDDHLGFKHFGEDVTTGNFNFLLVHAIQSRPDDKRILNIMSQKTTNPELISYCIQILKEFDCYDYTMNKIREVNNDIKAETARFGGNPLMDEIFATFTK